MEHIEYGAHSTSVEVSKLIEQCVNWQGHKQQWFAVYLCGKVIVHSALQQARVLFQMAGHLCLCLDVEAYSFLWSCISHFV